MNTPFPVVMKRVSDGHYLKRKDAWFSEWSPTLNEARMFPNQSAFTRAAWTLNDGYGKPASVDVVQVPVKIVEV
jgi:hypothetical protein